MYQSEICTRHLDTSTIFLVITSKEWKQVEPSNNELDPQF